MASRSLPPVPNALNLKLKIVPLSPRAGNPAPSLLITHAHYTLPAQIGKHICEAKYDGHNQTSVKRGTGNWQHNLHLSLHTRVTGYPACTWLHNLHLAYSTQESLATQLAPLTSPSKTSTRNALSFKSSSKPAPAASALSFKSAT